MVEPATHRILPSGQRLIEIFETGKYEVPDKWLAAGLRTQALEVVDVSLSTRPGHWIIQGHGVVTIEWLADDTCLMIRPKAGVESVAALARESGLPGLMLTDDLVGLQTTADATLLDFLAESLLRSLQPIEREGFIVMDQPRKTVQPYIRGALQIQESVLASLQSVNTAVVCSTSQATTDVLPNRAIASAIRLLHRRTDILNETNRANVRIAWNLWRRIADANVQANELLDWIRRRRTPIQRRYYEPALRAAHLVIVQAGQGQEYDDHYSWPPMRFDMPRIFEAAVRNWVAEGLGHGRVVRSPQQWRALYGELYLTDDQSLRAAGQLEPDVIASTPDGQAVGLVIDVKYKHALDPSDLYQLCAYALGLGLSDVGVVHVGDVAAQQIIRLAGGGVTLHEVQVDLSDLSAARQQVANLALDLWREKTSS